MPIPVHDYQDLYETEAGNNVQFIKLWLSYDVGSTAWWICLLLTIAPWGLWWFVRDRSKTSESLMIGTWILLITSMLDRVGLDYGLWYYNVHVVPIRLGLFPWDASLIPVTILLLLRFSQRTSMIRQAILYSLLVSFIGQPLFDEVLHYVSHVNWRYWYSTPFLFCLYAVAHRVYFKRQSPG